MNDKKSFLEKTSYTEQEKEAAPKLQLSQEELKNLNYWIQGMMTSRNQRNMNWPEFDDMDYPSYYYTNQKAANSYIQKKLNAQDVRIVTGTTEEKEVTLLAALLNFNLEAKVIPYTEEDEILTDLGEKLGDAVLRSRQMEEYDYEMARMEAYKELLDQGTVFVKEEYYERQEIEKNLKEKNWRESVKMQKTWSERLGRIQSNFRSKSLCGLNVYLGNIRQPYIQFQPYVFVREILSYAEAASIYGAWERFKYVPQDLSPLKPIQSDLTENYNSYIFENLEKGMVEMVECFCRSSNSYQILLNGVPMLPDGFPMSALTGQNYYPISQAQLFIIKNFAYGRGIPAKTKVSQAMADEWYRLALLKTRKSFQPPMANNTGKILSEEVFYPGTFTRDINPNQLQPIGDSDGLTSSEFEMLEFMQRTIDAQTVSPVFSGEGQSGEQSATEILETKKQAMMKLGIPVLACIFLEKQMAKLRLFNCMTHWTEPDEKFNPITQSMEESYRTYTVEKTFPDGVEGLSIVEFKKLGDSIPSEEQMDAENELLSLRYRKPVRKTYIDPEILTSIKLMFRFEVEPTEKNTDALNRAKFMDDITLGFQIFTPQAFNMGYLKSRYAQMMKEKKNNLFLPEGAMAPPGMEGMPAGAVDEAMGGVNSQAAQDQQAMLNTQPQERAIEDMTPVASMAG